jgi:uncharacterized protein YajQ (UPF0234 family)
MKPAAKKSSAFPLFAKEGVGGVRGLPLRSTLISGRCSMAQNNSFDIVSEVNLQEVDNGINMAQKELSNRYDFKGSKASIEFNRDKKTITLVADDDFKMRALKDIVMERLAKRGVSLKSLTYKDPEQAFEGTVRQVIELTVGFPKEKSKDLVALIKKLNPKAQVAIEGEKVRVSSPKKDELQSVMQNLKTADFALPLQFTNFR